jgi:hypothetical protein
MICFGTLPFLLYPFHLGRGGSNLRSQEVTTTRVGWISKSREPSIMLGSVFRSNFSAGLRRSGYASRRRRRRRPKRGGIPCARKVVGDYSLLRLLRSASAFSTAAAKHVSPARRRRRNRKRFIYHLPRTRQRRRPAHAPLWSGRRPRRHRASRQERRRRRPRHAFCVCQRSARFRPASGRSTATPAGDASETAGSARRGGRGAPAASLPLS